MKFPKISSLLNSLCTITAALKLENFLVGTILRNFDKFSQVIVNSRKFSKVTKFLYEMPVFFTNKISAYKIENFRV